MRNRLITTALAAAMLLLAAAGPSAANTTQQTMLQDDAQLVYVSPDQRNQRLDEIKGLGVEIVKVRVNWRNVAPHAKRKPSGFNGADPNAYPAGAWDAYDGVVQAAQARGMSVMFQLGGSAPEWATPGRRNSQIYKPNASEFGKFAQAVGTRYPSVHLFSVWNEPNLASWLAPQTRAGVPYAPAIYRRLLYAGAGGLKASGHGRDQLLFGELLPFSRSARKSSTKIRPLAFLREMACLNSHYRPYRGKAAKKRACPKKFRKLPGTGVAYHPYTLAGGPNIRTPNRDDASIRDLGRVTHALDKIAGRHRVGRRLPIWITEFGFQTRPPDTYATPMRRVPGFLAQSEWIAFHNRRVASYSQYELFDDPAPAGFQTGLRFKNGKMKKTVYRAFQHTFYVRRKGSRVELFGCERAATSGRVTVQARIGRRGAWKKVTTAGINKRGYFDRKVRVSGAGSKQFRYRYGSATSRVTGAAG